MGINDSSLAANSSRQPLTELLKSKTFLLVAGTALSTIVIYGIYNKIANQAQSNKDSELSQVERTKIFIRKELERLSDPPLTEDGYLQKEDFFDIIMLIQLKSKLKLQKEVARNQRLRERLLKLALNTNEYLDYYNKTIEIMHREFDHYEVQYQKILRTIGVEIETWEMSKELYIQPESYIDHESAETQTIQAIEKRVYAHLPLPNIPKSLTKEQTKNYMMDVNHRAVVIFQRNIREFNEQLEYEPLLIETLAFDLAYIEYGYQENIFRYAIHKYELQNDPEIKDNLDFELSH